MSQFHLNSTGSGTCAVLIAASTALLSLSSAHGQTSSGNETSIVVLGGTLPLPPGTPAYGDVVIPRDRLSSLASARVEDALRDVAGFSQFRRSDSRSANPSAQGANFRSLGGNASSRTLVLLDGVPMGDPFFGYIPYAAFAPETLSGIRVTRGGGNGAFGAGAVAGTIEMASATRDDLAHFSASAFYGSRNATSLSVTAAPDVGAGYVSLSGSWDRGDGFFTTPADQRAPASATARYESWSASARAVAPLGDAMEIQARALIYRDDRTLRFRGADSHSEAQDASIRLLSRGAWQVDALAYVQVRNFSNIVISSSSFRKALDQNDTPALGLGGKVELRPPVGGDHLLRIGADIRRASGDMHETAYNAGSSLNPVTARRHASGRQLTAGFFIEDDWTLGNVIVTGGARADRWTITDGRFQSLSPTGIVTADTSYPDRSGWEGSFRAGLLWHAGAALSLRTAAYTGFRLPTLNELYRGFVVFPITYQANENLRPERLKGAEAGFDFRPAKGIDLGATVFVNRLDNAIANVTIGTNLRQRQNVDAVLSRGVELTASGKTGPWALSASYTLAHSEVEASGTPLDGQWPQQSPRHSGSATVSFSSVAGPSVGATLRYAGKQYEDDLGMDVLPDAWTVDAFARIPLLRGLSIVARGENLTDSRVLTRNAGGSIDLGTPRTLWIGFEFGLDR
ncbi:MAG: TonB-dependent receptor [Sphingobium sp.]